MNTKLLYVLLGLLATAASTTTTVAAASSDSSSSAAEAAIPLCNQTELITVADLMKMNARKKECQAELKVKEMLRAKDKKALCKLTPCTAALKSLYVTLPDCRYLDWGIKYNVERLLMFCGIDPKTIDDGSIDGSEETDSGSGSEPAETQAPDWNVSSSSGDVTFAPIGGNTVAPVTAAPVPSPSPTTSGSVAYTTSAAVAVATAVVGLVAL